MVLRHLPSHRVRAMCATTQMLTGQRKGQAALSKATASQDAGPNDCATTERARQGLNVKPHTNECLVLCMLTSTGLMIEVEAL